jgi:hypothetical protein
MRVTYSVKFKLTVLRRMRDERLSYRQAAALFDIRNFILSLHGSATTIRADWRPCLRTLPYAARR